MRIEIIDQNADEITFFELESNPFIVGQTINIQIMNYDKTNWNTEEINQSFNITHIEHYFRKEYLKSRNTSEVFTINVTVIPKE